jgi:hypothetical protein
VFNAARWQSPSSLSPEGGGCSSGYNHFSGSETEPNNLLMQNVGRVAQIAETREACARQSTCSALPSPASGPLTQT